MPVLSVLIPAQDESRLAVTACKFGVEAEKIDSEDGSLYVDLYGSSLKTRQVAESIGAEILDEVPFVDRIKPVYDA